MIQIDRKRSERLDMPLKPYTSSQELMREVEEAAKALGLRLVVKKSESEYSVEVWRGGKRVSQFESDNPALVLRAKGIAILGALDRRRLGL